MLLDELRNAIPSGRRLGMRVGQDQKDPARREWPKITLVTPVFNSARYIEQTIQSVISQQYPNLEYFSECLGNLADVCFWVQSSVSNLASGLGQQFCRF